MHKKGHDFLITERNIVIYKFDSYHDTYKIFNKKLFCLNDNDLVKHDIISYEFDNIMAIEGTF